MDREDLNYIGIDGNTYWATVGEDELELPGPFLFCVNNTGAWLGTYSPWVHHLVTTQIHYDNADLLRSAHWRRSAEVWLRDAPINRLQMLRRYQSIEKRLVSIERKWSSWDEIYGWSEASSLMWGGLSVHRHITAFEIEGVRSVLWTGNKAWLRHWARTEGHRVTDWGCGFNSHLKAEVRNVSQGR